MKGNCLATARVFYWSYLTSTIRFIVIFFIMYFASPGELTNVAAGFGFTGFKDDGSENWDMIDNANIWGVEVCDAIKSVFNLLSIKY